MRYTNYGVKKRLDNGNVGTHGRAFTQTVIEKKESKGAWWMPRLSEAKKDVISCDKLGVVANKL